MSLFAATTALYCGFVVCEFNRVIVPFTSVYKKKSDAEKTAGAVVMELFDLEATCVYIYPIAQEESISELIESTAADLATTGEEWHVFDPIIVQPHRAKTRNEEQARAERDEFDRSLNDAGFLIGELTARGYAAAYSRGANVWCNAEKDDPVMLALGMRWSENRGQWWRRAITEGRAQRTALTHKDQIAARADYPYVA